MFNAQILQAEALTTTAVYGPWMSREGDRLIATLDLIAITGAGNAQIQVYTKSHEDAGDGSLATGAAIAPILAGRSSSEFSGLKDLVRYKMQYTGGEGSAGFILFRLLPGIWFDAVSA